MDIECGICYESKIGADFEVLDCNHSICKCCLSKLRSHTCPFCRNPIPSYFDKLLPNENDYIFPNDNENIPYEIDIELTILTQRTRQRQRQRRRRENRNTFQNNYEENSSIVSNSHMNDILNQINITLNNQQNIVHKKESISDKHKHKNKYHKNSWKTQKKLSKRK